MIITPEIKSIFKKINDKKEESDQQSSGYYSSRSREIETEDLNNYLLELGLVGEDLLNMISEYNDIYYFKEFNSKFVNASISMDMIDGFLYDSNLKTILGLSNKRNSNSLKLNKIETEEEKIIRKIEELNFSSKIYSDKNTFSKETDIVKSNYRVLSNKINTSNFRKTSLGLTMSYLDSLNRDASNKNIIPEKLFMFINISGFISLILNKTPIPNDNFHYKSNLTKEDYESNKHLIINLNNQYSLYDFLKSKEVVEESENIFINFSVKYTKEVYGFSNYFNKKPSIENQSRIIITSGGKLVSSVFARSYSTQKLSKLKQMNESKVEYLITAYNSDVNEIIEKSMLLELQEHLKKEIIKKDKYLYRVTTTGIFKKIYSKLFGIKKELIYLEKKSAKEVLIRGDMGFVSNFIDKIETIFETQDLLLMFKKDEKLYSTEIEEFINNITIATSLPPSEFKKIRKWFKRKISPNDRELLTMKYEDSNNKLYDFLIKSNIRTEDKKSDVVYCLRSDFKEFADFIEEINTCIEKEITVLDLLLLLNQRELLIFK